MIFVNYRLHAARSAFAIVPVIDLAPHEPRQGAQRPRSTTAMSDQFEGGCAAGGRPEVAAETLIAKAMATIQRRGEEGKSALGAALKSPERCRALPQSTSRAAEQSARQHARGFIPDCRLLLLGRTTASLGAANRAVVVEMTTEENARVLEMVAIVHTRKSESDRRRIVMGLSLTR